jgi:predicted DNA binding CopG/RHH family protein
MDTLNSDDLFDISWLDEAMPDIPELPPEDVAMVEAMMEQAKAERVAKAKLRGLRRKKEDLAAGPSQKITIRIPRPILDLLKTQAALRGLPYQTYLNHLIYQGATR